MITTRNLDAEVEGFFTILRRESSQVDQFGRSLTQSAARNIKLTEVQTRLLASLASVSRRIEALLQEVFANTHNGRSAVEQLKAKISDGEGGLDSLAKTLQDFRAASAPIRSLSEIVDEISEKTKVVNRIVLKTQLLSFNASIEASNAGQHGRGFAVVAEEIGNLARISGSAAKEIEELILQSKGDVRAILERNVASSDSARKSFEKTHACLQGIRADSEGIDNRLSRLIIVSEQQQKSLLQEAEFLEKLKESVQSTIVAANFSKQISARLLEEGESLKELGHSLRVRTSVQNTA